MKTLLLLTLLAGLQPLSAQLAITIELERTDFVAHEAITANVTIQNQAGKNIALGGPGGQSWLQFNIQRTEPEGVVMASNGDPMVEPIMLKDGASITKKINLSRFYPMDDASAYMVNCSVYFPDLQKWIGAGSKALVRVRSPKSPFYENTVGVPKTHPQAGRYRRYRLFTNKSQMPVAQGRIQQVELLYVSIMDEQTEENIVTFPLGPILTYRNPQPTTDRSGSLCVLYMATPQLYQYAVIDVDGAVKEQATYKAGSGSPELMKTNTGEVRVRGGVIFDAIDEEVKARDPKNKIRGINERPN